MNCLFVQWKKPTDASRFVIDGIKSEYSGTKRQNKIMQLLSEVPKAKEICKNDGRQGFSPSFRCSTLKSINYIEGNFEETDIAGRNLVYIFATQEPSSQRIAEILQEYSSLLGVTPFSSDIEEIKKQTFKKKTSYRKIINSIIIAIAIILLLLFMLLTLKNKPSTINGNQEPMDSIENVIQNKLIQ